MVVDRTYSVPLKESQNITKPWNNFFQANTINSVTPCAARIALPGASVRPPICLRRHPLCLNFNWFLEHMQMHGLSTAIEWRFGTSWGVPPTFGAQVIYLQHGEFSRTQICKCFERDQCCQELRHAYFRKSNTQIPKRSYAAPFVPGKLPKKATKSLIFRRYFVNLNPPDIP